MPDRPIPEEVWARLRRMLAEMKAAHRSGPVVVLLNCKHGEVVGGHVLADEPPPVVHTG